MLASGRWLFGTSQRRPLSSILSSKVPGHIGHRGGPFCPSPALQGSRRQDVCERLSGTYRKIQPLQGFWQNPPLGPAAGKAPALAHHAGNEKTGPGSRAICLLSLRCTAPLAPGYVPVFRTTSPSIRCRRHSVTRSGAAAVLQGGVGSSPQREPLCAGHQPVPGPGRGYPKLNL